MGLSFAEGLVKASSMILVSEIGDKTFFVAALMAMRHPRRYVLAGSLAALWLMTTLSALFGWAAPNLLSRQWTNTLAMLLFFGFGLRSLWDGLTMTHAKSQVELMEVEAQLKEVEGEVGGAADDTEHEKERDKEKEEKHMGHGSNSSCSSSSSQASKEGPLNGVISTATKRSSGSASEGGQRGEQQDLQNGHAGTEKEEKEGKGRGQHPPLWHSFLSPVFVQTFSLVFLGEWGDKSQIATIGLGAEENLWGVALGGCLGHAVCSGAAVLGGRHLASRISDRAVATFGGLLFIGFGLHSLLHGPGH